MPGSKVCSSCKIEKDLSFFCKSSNRPDGLHYYCRSCSLAKQKKFRTNRQARKRLEIRYLYGHDFDFEGTLEKQNGLCAICREPESVRHAWTSGPKNLAVDHCHKTGKIRGLLCDRCNRGLGYFRDSPELLVQAIEYLEK